MKHVHRDILCAALALGLAVGGCRREPPASPPPAQSAPPSANAAPGESPNPESEPVMKSDAQWREELSEREYHVLREKGTEPPFQNAYFNHKEPGRYVCAGCGQPLFDSATKYDSGTGWPSFYQPINPEAVDTEADRTLGMTRTEVLCSQCGGHLGHVFEDGPKPTGLRYCINSAALQHVSADAEADASDRAAP